MSKVYSMMLKLPTPDQWGVIVVVVVVVVGGGGGGGGVSGGIEDTYNSSFSFV